MLREKEILWRKNKYEVMSHSENSYRLIQKVIQEVSFSELTEIINEAKKHPSTTGSVTNTYQHVWGYFKKKATQAEKEKTFSLLNAYQEGTLEAEKLWVWLARLAVKYEQPYLLESTLIAKHLTE